MNNLIQLSNIDCISLNDVVINKSKNIYVFMKYYNDLNNHKNIIDNYNQEWDTYKKYMNPYELIYSPYDRTTNTSNYKPISRSFFKMWEMLNRFSIIKPDDSIVIANIAEGPGGFIEAIHKYKKHNSNDIYISNTLYPSNKNIPSWNKLKKYINDNNFSNIKLLYCDLYNYENVLKYISNFKDTKSKFVTGDGGFDYSNNFNKQEEQSHKIIYSEIIIALAIQEIGGSFILKIFDTFTLFTLKYIYILSIFYETIQLYKPYTSRVANSEKYIICKGFKGIKDELLNKFLISIRDFSNISVDITNIKLPNDFIYEFDNYNKIFINNQIDFINKTLNIIKNKDNVNLENIVQEQLRNAKKWCEEYNFK